MHVLQGDRFVARFPPWPPPRHPLSRP
jgi:hypothetical protein